MIKESELDEDQIKVLMATLDKSCIVAGCAGSGKSILALIKAQRIQKERGNNYKVIVFTKALCHYMNTGRKELGLRNEFYYHWHWKNRMNCSPADYIIVDEIQDFDKDEISEFISATNKNFFFFGDTAQSIYEGLNPQFLSMILDWKCLYPAQRQRTLNCFEIIVFHCQ
ncbi:MAG: AAA family ATPase [Bacteroidales bacterium]|nr:MAG: AAA family ATPase [Bacteroidales bacterium]